MKHTIKRTITAICIALATIVSLLAPATPATAASSYDIQILGPWDGVAVGQEWAFTIDKVLGKNKTVTIPQKNYKKEKITFKSSNAKVATVSSKGVIAGKKAGTVTITIGYKYGKKKVPVKVGKYYVDHKISIRGKSLDLSKKYTEEQITSLFGAYSRKSEKYYTESSSDYRFVKSKTKNGYYISYTDDYKEFAMFEFIDNTLTNVYTSASSFESGNVKMGLDDKDFSYITASLYVIYNLLFDTKGSGKGDLQLVWIRMNYGAWPYMGENEYKSYAEGMKASTLYKVPKDLYLMEMDFVNALRAKHLEKYNLGYLQWSDKAMEACKQHIETCWKDGDYSIHASDGLDVEDRVAKLLGIQWQYLSKDWAMDTESRAPFESVADYYSSVNKREALLGNLKYFGAYTNGRCDVVCMFGEYIVDYENGAVQNVWDFEDPTSVREYYDSDGELCVDELSPFFDDIMKNYTGAN